MKNKVSLIIPTINRASLGLTLKAIEEQTRKVDELIIIEDLDRKGPAWARNRGIEQATGDLIAFLDDDCIPTKNWLKRMLNAFNDFNADVVGGTLAETDRFLHQVRKLRSFPNEVLIDEEGFVGCSCNIIYSKKILQQCKQHFSYYFNERFELASGEDMELAWRLRSLGAKFVFVPANPKHLKTVNFWTFQKLQFKRGIGIAQLDAIGQNIATGIKPVQKSMLWENNKSNQWIKWASILLKKVLGPFNIKAFDQTRYFFWYWAGEKSKAFGYLIKKFLIFQENLFNAKGN